MPRATGLLETPKTAAAPVPVKINSLEAWIASTAVNGATGDVATEGVIVFGYRKGKAAAIAVCGRIEAESAFHDIPTIVRSTGTAGWLKIHFLSRRLSHIGNIKIPRLTIEGGTPGIAHPECPDLAAGVCSISVRIARRNRIGCRITRFHVDSHNLSAQNTNVLSQRIGASG